MTTLCVCYRGTARILVTFTIKFLTFIVIMYLKAEDMNSRTPDPIFSAP